MISMALGYKCQDLGSKVRPQTNITDIDKNLKPFYFYGVDPAKIVMSIAYYGGTYTLSNPSCGSMSCSSVSGEGGAAGSYTDSSGILSNQENKQITKDEGIKPYLNKSAMVKHFICKSRSWVGYDDAVTYVMKESYANARCLGCIMILSVVFDDETGIGLESGNSFKFPESAIVIPMAHTRVPAGQTFTLDNGAATDIPRLPAAGNQTSLPGPPNYQQCSFFDSSPQQVAAMMALLEIQFLFQPELQSRWIYHYPRGSNSLNHSEPQLSRHSCKPTTSKGGHHPTGYTFYATFRCWA